MAAATRNTSGRFSGRTKVRYEAAATVAAGAPKTAQARKSHAVAALAPRPRPSRAKA